MTKKIAWGVEVIIGDRKDESNPFNWDSVVQNCPGTNYYDPSTPRLYRWDSKLQVITAACKDFLYDSRSVAATQTLSRDVIHRIKTVMGYLGLQDATRKGRPNSQTPGEWTGSITFSLENISPCVTLSEKKWGRPK